MIEIKNKMTVKKNKNESKNNEIVGVSLRMPLNLHSKVSILASKNFSSISGFILSLLDKETKKHKFDEESLKLSSGVEELEALTPEIIKQKFEQSMKKNFFEED